MNMAFPPLTIGSVIALLVILLAILGMIGVLPDSPVVGFGLVAALGVARLT